MPNGDKITIADLSEMRSGLYSFSFDESFNETLDADPQKAWQPEEPLAIAFAQPVQFEAGDKFNYSNTNIVLLGVIIEKHTGMSAPEAFKERIFDPLTLDSTLLPELDDASIPDPYPRGYIFGTNVSTLESAALTDEEQAAAVAGTLEPNDVTDANPSWAWTAGAAISTAEDMTTYTKALVTAELLEPEMQQRRLDSITPMNPDEPQIGGYGLGIAHFGPGLLGHDGQIPGYMSVAAYDPEMDLTVIILTNLFASPNGEGAALSILKPLVGYFYGASAVPGSPAAKPGAGTTTTTP